MNKFSYYVEKFQQIAGEESCQGEKYEEAKAMLSMAYAASFDRNVRIFWELLQNAGKSHLEIFELYQKNGFPIGEELINLTWELV